MSINYVITDDYIVLASVDLIESDRLAVSSSYSVINEETLQALIDAGVSVTYENEEDAND